VLALAGLFQQVNRAPAHHVHTVIDKVLYGLDEPHLLRLAIYHGQEDHAEARLQVSVLVKLVEDDLFFRPALQLHDNPHSVAA
jgi:hypothetical protein